MSKPRWAKYKRLLIIENRRFLWGSTLIFIDSFNSFLKGELWLDVGANNLFLGERILGTAPKKIEYYGLDAINYEDKLKEYPFVCADAGHLPFKDAIFDFVSMIEVLGHIPSPYHALREAYRVLKEGGRLFIQEIHGFKAPKNFHDDRTHFTLFTVITMFRLLDYAGFQIHVCERRGTNIIAMVSKVTSPNNENAEPYLITRRDAHSVISVLRRMGFEAVPSGRVAWLGWSDTDLDVHILNDLHSHKCRCAKAVRRLVVPFVVCVMCWKCEKSYYVKPNGTGVIEYKWKKPPLGLDLHVEISKGLYDRGFTILDF